jgi:signal transduction histidine kinase
LKVLRSCPIITPKHARSSLQLLAMARAMSVLCAWIGRLLARRSSTLEKCSPSGLSHEELDETNRSVDAFYAELDTQARQLQRATDLKTRFLADMSQEFRTPISAVRSLSQLLLDRIDSPLTTEMVGLFFALRGVFWPVLTSPDVTRVFEDPQQSSWLLTDDKKLSHILRNFVSNAL